MGNEKMSHAARRSAKAARNSRAALEMRAQGYKIREIADALDVKPASIHRYINDASKELREAGNSHFIKYVAKHNAVLEGLLRKVYPHVTQRNADGQLYVDPKMAELVLKTLEQQRKLLGLSAPERVEVVVDSKFHLDINGADDEMMRILARMADPRVIEVKADE